ncbi:MAG: hypothetical protein ABWY55_00320 [Microbacterium sp.]
MTIDAAPRVVSPVAATEPQRLRGATAIIAVAIIGSLYGQRFVIPGMRVSAGFLILVLLAIIAVALNVGRIQVGRALVALALAGSASALALVSGLWTPFTPSLESLLLLIVAWMPFAVIARGRAPWKPVRWDVVFFWCALPAAAAVVLQFALQFTGVGFLDPVMDLPANIRWTDTEYSVSYEYVWGTGLQKPNGFFFAEPSLAAQFMCLGVFAALSYKPVWAILFVAAVALTASGTGTIALGVGLVFAFIAAGPILRIAMVLFTAVLIPIVLSIPLIGDAFLGRGTDLLNEGDGSGNARFVDPFTVVAWAVQRFPQVVLTGFGPGTADLASVASGNPLANPTFVSKAILEYGVPFALTLTFVIAFAILSARGVTLANRVVLVTMIFFLSGALIQGPTGLLLWSALFAAPSRYDVLDHTDPPLWRTMPWSRTRTEPLFAAGSVGGVSPSYR